MKETQNITTAFADVRLPAPARLGHAHSPRCGILRSGCAFNSSEQLDLNENLSHPPWRHALIISTPARFIRAAAEARRAGFVPSLIHGIFRNWSLCHPQANWSDRSIRPVVKLDNSIDAYRQALERIAETNVAHAVFEDDIVLATSRAEVQAWLDSPAAGERSYRKRSSDNRRWQVEVQRFSRADFDMVPLGTCGATTNFACAHAMWYTPAGARAALAAYPRRCTRSDASGVVIVDKPIFDLHLYIDRAPGHSGAGKMCSTECAPNRTLTPTCWDSQSRTVIANRNCTDERLQQGLCSRDVLRCVDWQELKVYRGHGFPSRQRGRKFKPSRYMGYGHFLQDRLGVIPYLHTSQNHDVTDESNARPLKKGRARSL